MAGRGRLSKGRKVKVEDAGSARPEMAADSPVIVAAPNPTKGIVGSLVKGLIGLALLILLIVAATYIAVAGTVATPLKSGEQYVFVMRNAYAIGSAPAGSLMFIQTREVDNDILTKVQQSVLGVPDGGVVQIIAGPGSRVGNTKDGFVTVNGDPTAYVGEVSAEGINAANPGLLDANYLAVCISGSCGDPNAIIVLPERFVMGEATGYIDGFSLLPIPTTVPATTNTATQ